MTADNPRPEDKLGEAIEEAQRKAQEDERWTSHLALHELAARLRYDDVVLRWQHHDAIHREQDEAVRTALSAVTKEQAAHVIAHDAAHAAHEREHTLVAKSLDDRRLSHEREHELHSTAHDREHGAQEAAVAKVESTTEKRFESVNEFREQLREQAGTFARGDRLDQMQKDLDRRFDEVKLAITNLEKGDVGQQGRALGQGAVIAIIVGAVSFVGAILGIIVVLANVLSAPG